MSPARLYQKYIKNNMFTKMLLLIALIAVVTIVTLSFLMYYFLFQSAVRSELDIQRSAVERVERHLNQKYENAQSYVNDLYRNSSLGIDTSYFLMNSFNEYMAKRMNRIAGGGQSNSDSVVAYFKQRLDDDPDIENIMLYSAEKQYVYVYKQGSMTRLYQANATHSYIPDVMALESQSVTLPNLWIRKLAGDVTLPLFSIRSPINDMTTYKNLGQLLILYRTEALDAVLNNSDDSLKGSVLVLSGDGRVMFDSSGKYYGEKYPYADQLLNSKETVTLDEESYITTAAHNQAGYTVVGITPKREIAESFHGLQSTIIIAALLCIVIAVSIPSLMIVNYSRRTDNIIRFMRKVEKGEFVARMQDTKDDQLGQIAGSFNEMLDELSRYIDKVYKAEINQKNAELSALQARINPHFLYNTLEVIRMRALSQGAQDVGDMIYSLSMLFKNIVQHKSHYTLKDELEACRLYLELFRIRYKDKYIYKMHCDDQIKHVPMIKMSLQPLIENYIVHGLRSDQDDNWLTINATQEDDEVHIEIKDNGKGIPPQRLEEIKSRLDVAESSGESFGLRSVNERLKLTYGSSYGMDIQSEPGNGTTVTVKFPVTERKLNNDV
ncbi:sensor histidine kinase [Paenibacillus lautus]|uniref:histidine kinase n=1 Tax=Paenibacillus lautus TaxID=1401 RepID=A0A385TT12_PAELA|nr:sensor histidine kinase [Paenibacillus lautus]AYB45497.1 sensor histidine kinase [Paenibacillus lautus]MBY0158179.1 sensor histidine kinase [Cytobacillus firmus]VTR26371.1 Inner membrane protein ypdA [Actinobacillus pleuropneumoniae]